jgi:hypothetical protein
MKCRFEIDGKRYVKRLAPGEHVPGFIEHTSDPVTFPAVESPEDAARLDKQYEEAMLAIQSSPPKIVEDADPNYSVDRVHALESEIGRCNKIISDLTEKFAATLKMPEVKMKWLVNSSAGLDVMELGPGINSNMKRVCPLPLDFTKEDLPFIKMDGSIVKIDFVAREAHKKDLKWNKLSPVQRLKNAVSRG